MNLRTWVWLPPDGDNRLVRFQQAAAAVALGPDAALVPPFVALNAPGRRPLGALSVADWTLLGTEPVLEARDAEGPVGQVRLFFPWPPGKVALSSLPPPPPWTWSRGRTGFLNLELPDGDPSFVLWSWESLSGWKSDPPKG